MIANSIPLGFSRSSKALRQGNPLSSYLFVVVVEALRYLVKRAREDEYLIRVRVRGKYGKWEQVSHFMFSNETLVFL